ncbi:MAG: hypothetical protein PHW64_03610 [Sulfuricurvum sp.]|nr:hypothetical protein [Sulfuricurvum sp.]
MGVSSKLGVSSFTSRFEKSGLDIHHALEMDDSALSAVLFPELKQYLKSSTTKPHPDWNYVHSDHIMHAK